ncbi:helix-turn-helix domain-containing protein [Streptomyces sp. NRRL F-5755]|uniref:helix-turn-helix domain-containing protein n=1 Tax=Streptomyces sp. NRRL F-5755 TaxID=1519475 RepID=UPI001F2E0505|nr:helix-turn-helix domain-containing protein [Streptomyces sp. NRRL F-5755]
MIPPILEAAWDELRERGYANLTVDSVARRAGTSKPVLHRRWADKQKLVEAAVVRRNADQMVPPADTGTLRGDLITTLTETSERQGPFLSSFNSACCSPATSPRPIPASPVCAR